MRRVALLFVIGSALVAGGCLELVETQAGDRPDGESSGATESSPSPTAIDTQLNGTLSVHYLDVGQADATVLEFPNGETMLIDSGDWPQDGERVLAFLEGRDINRLDHLVATHPHADHIGGHEAVIDHVETDGEGIGAAYDSGLAHTSGTYEEYLDAVERHDVDLFTVQAGDEFTVGNATVEFLNPPVERDSDELHPNSVSLVVTYGEAAFLFTGDLEAPGEERLLSNWSNQTDADVYQAGHHGSRTSSAPEFLDAVDPSAVVISSAFDSQYGHPHNETLAAFAERNYVTFWTAVHGDVTVRTNGSSLAITTETEGPTDPDELRERRSEGVTPALLAPAQLDPTWLDPADYAAGGPIRAVP